MRLTRIIIPALLVLLIIDLYVIRNIFLYHSLGEIQFNVSYVVSVFAVISLLIILGLFYTGMNFQHMRDPHMYTRVMWIMGLFLMTFLPKLVFSISGIVSDLLLLISRFTSAPETYTKARSLILTVGIILGGLLFLSIAMGMIRGRFHVKVHRYSLRIKNLPRGLEGLKMIHMSDLHLSSLYYHRDHLKKWVTRINAMKPDLFLFSGDMVNNFAEELEPFISILNKISPRMGKFAVLGNHDYGKYHQWNSPEKELENLEMVKENIRKAGFDLLLNEHRMLSRSEARFSIIGVENYGKPPFPQVGDLEKATTGLNGSVFNILLSHDPFHWEQKVRYLDDIHLTLSGHTHGMQFGFEIGKLRWSPSRWQYRHWAGLYNENGKYLNVNRGFGTIGFPGRVGIRPEVTEITLVSF